MKLSAQTVRLTEKVLRRTKKDLFVTNPNVETLSSIVENVETVVHCHTTGTTSLVSTCVKITLEPHHLASWLQLTR